MTTYETWDDIPFSLVVYTKEHDLFVLRTDSADIVCIPETGGRLGWVPVTTRLRGPFETVYGQLVSLEQCIAPKPEPTPMQWDSLADVPTDIRVRDRDGDTWKHNKRGWNFRGEDGNWVVWAPYRAADASGAGPFTEIVK